MIIPNTPASGQQPSRRCAFCGESYVCEHGKCTACQSCKACRRLDDAWGDLGTELERMADEET